METYILQYISRGWGWKVSISLSPLELLQFIKLFVPCYKYKLHKVSLNSEPDISFFCKAYTISLHKLHAIPVLECPGANCHILSLGLSCWGDHLGGNCHFNYELRKNRLVNDYRCIPDADQHNVWRARAVSFISFPTMETKLCTKLAVNHVCPSLVSQLIAVFSFVFYLCIICSFGSTLKVCSK